MNPRLSVIITVLNDFAELSATVLSLRQTASPSTDIVVIDDASSTPVVIDGARVIRNRQRCGVGPSRHIGALTATGDWILFTDSHMRFKPGWYEAALQHFSEGDKTLWCGTCLGLTPTNTNLDYPNATYHGGTMNVLGPDRNNPKITQVFEPIWSKEPKDELACVMGASYFMPRDWYLKLGGLQYLRSWGMDEVVLSLKTWLAGGSVRLARDVIIGHVWRAGERKPPYAVPTGDVVYNKAFLMHTLLPPLLARRLQSSLTKGPDTLKGLSQLRDDWHLVEVETAHNKSLFVNDFYWYAEKFGLAYPRN